LKKGAALAFVIAVLAIGWFWAVPTIKIDKCLDGGGRWDNQTKSCQFAAGNRK
jgi:hypothetical protein